MAADSPGATLSAAELQALRRLIADNRRPGYSAHPLAVTFSGVFAAGFLALFGWIAFQTHTNSAAIAVLQTDVVGLQADVAELKADVEELKADVAEIKADGAELKAGQAEMRAGMQELKALILEQQRR